MYQDYNLVAKFTDLWRENLRQGMHGILTETTNGSVAGFVAVPFVSSSQVMAQ